SHHIDPLHDVRCRSLARLHSHGRLARRFFHRTFLFARRRTSVDDHPEEEEQGGRNPFFPRCLSLSHLLLPFFAHIPAKMRFRTRASPSRPSSNSVWPRCTSMA